MVRLSKSALFGKFEDALRDSGWGFLHISPKNAHPAAYHVYRNGTNFRVRLYVWNLTPGGKNRPEDEWRIQVTGLPEPAGSQQFVPEPGAKNLILGWWSDLDIFAAFDMTHHLAPLGRSPSLQIRQHALEVAHINGISFYFRGKDEIAFVIRPEFMGAYIENQEELHKCASSEQILSILHDLTEDPDSIDEKDIEAKVPGPRKFVVIATKKALRDANFNNRVLTAYRNQCAMCGIQLKLLDAAHILPAAHPDSTDETANGVALCALHHRAFDRGFVTFDKKYRTHFNLDMEQEFRQLGLDGGLDAFKAAVFPVIKLPPDTKDRPKAIYIERVNEMRSWNL